MPSNLSSRWRSLVRGETAQDAAQSTNAGEVEGMASPNSPTCYTANAVPVAHFFGGHVMLPHPGDDHAYAFGLRTSDSRALIVAFELGGHGCEHRSPVWIEVSDFGNSPQGRNGFHAPYRCWKIPRTSDVILQEDVGKRRTMSLVEYLGFAYRY